MVRVSKPSRSQWAGDFACGTLRQLSPPSLLT
jgi:hypothetical protein